MMVDEEAEVFEITDFTTASEWERFVARLEEIFHDWKLADVSFSHFSEEINLNEGKWSEVNVLLKYADHEFILSHHYFQPNSSAATSEAIFPDNNLKTNKTEESTANEEVSRVWHEMLGGSQKASQVFPPRAHCLCRWYGLRSFLILAPPAVADDVFSESRINMLLSSLSIAAFNTSCQIPVFVQAHSKWRRLFLGSFETAGFRTNFDMVHLRSIPPFCRHLSGLLDVFKDKLGSSTYQTPPINISVRFTYVVQDFKSELWPQLQSSSTEVEKEQPISNINVSFSELPFGLSEDPILEFQLSVTWPSLLEEYIIENDSYSDLDPLKAPDWSLRLRFIDSPPCLLGDLLMEFAKLNLRKESIQQILGKIQDNANSNTEVDAALALQRLTDPHLSTTLTHAVRRAKNSFVLRADEAPIPVKLLNEILLFIFPDARPDNSSNDNRSQDTIPKALSNYPELKECLKQIKSGEESSLVWRLAISCCVVNGRYGGVKAVAHLWQELVMEMRYRWENNYPIPSLEPGSPNLANCLLYQKLQMLNCCIVKKKSREQEVDESETQNKNADEEDDEDEFFECIDEATLPAPTSPTKTKSVQLPEGRSRPLDKYLLINNGEQMFVPITQEAGPMTEDLIDEQADVFSRLGTTTEGALLRARLQSASLLSDMEAFQAANPGCLLQDFVRWYSPRDWVVEPNSDPSSCKGELSQRMQIVGNMWIEIWQSAKPVPVKKQKRLFDDTKEAEKVLHWLSSLSPSQVALQLMPIVLHAAIYKLLENNIEKFEVYEKMVGETATHLVKISRLPQIEMKPYEDIISRIKMVEIMIARNESLIEKFSAGGQIADQSDVQKFIWNLIEVGGEVGIMGASTSPVGAILKNIFCASASKQLNTTAVSKLAGTATNVLLPATDMTPLDRFPPSIGREYLFRCMVPRPAPWSRPSPQRMFCTCVSSEFRLAAAFTSDTLFQ